MITAKARPSYFVISAIVLMLFPLPSSAGSGQGDTASNEYAGLLRDLRSGASKGDAESMVTLGTLYKKGEGVLQDYEEAAKWFRQAAEQGNALGQLNLGVMYQEGKGVKKDPAQAAKYYKMAAEQGQTIAQVLLGILYRHGQGVPKDYVYAHMWFNIAGAAGNEKGTQGRHLIEKEMTSDQITKAQRLAREWKPKD